MSKEQDLLQTQLEAASKCIGYQFNNPLYLNLALTHRSAAQEHNERLEFLGDAVLGLIIGELLYRKFPEATEGQLSHLRMSLIKGETLAKVAETLGLSEFIQLGAGEKRSGGKYRKSILENTLEAIIGGIYLDSDFSICGQVVVPWFREWLQNLELSDEVRDAKSVLQEMVQAAKLNLPVYEIIDVQGKEHDQTFTVQCIVKELKLCEVAQGKSRKKAEQAAAEKTLLRARAILEEISTDNGQA